MLISVFSDAIAEMHQNQFYYIIFKNHCWGGFARDKNAVLHGVLSIAFAFVSIYLQHEEVASTETSFNIYCMIN